MAGLDRAIQFLAFHNFPSRRRRGLFFDPVPVALGSAPRRELLLLYVLEGGVCCPDTDLDTGRLLRRYPHGKARGKSEKEEDNGAEV